MCRECPARAFAVPQLAESRAASLAYSTVIAVFWTQRTPCNARDDRAGAFVFEVLAGSIDLVSSTTLVIMGFKTLSVLALFSLQVLAALAKVEVSNSSPSAMRHPARDC